VVIAPGEPWLQRLLHEGERGRLVSGLGDEALEHLALVIDSAPEVDHLPVELHVHLIQVPAPMPEPSHARHALAPRLAREERAEPVPPEAYRLVAKVDAALEQQILDVPQR
jgi:hypothetical protein